MSHDMKLGVNIDHVATIRQARFTAYPDLADAVRAAERGGADGITLHLREDRRHIQDADVWSLKKTITSKMNLEMAVTGEMIDIATALKPQDCCLVPERREELTTEGGLDVAGQLQRMVDACARLAGAGIRVSLFVDPDPDQVEASARAGAPVIEIHTGRYADATDATVRDEEFNRIQNAVERGLDLGLTVNAGHGLSYQNVQPIAALPGITELNIGHSIVARALFVGMEAAVREMKQLMTLAGEQ